MFQEIDVSDDDISYAEKILLKNNANFDQERRNFIRNFSTLDLQAVPGSGKTTALLAKLIILERNMPLQNDCGILFLSHTNVAINEVRHQVEKYCPKLFEHPNFIGTIQGFVDQFLAIPFYRQKFKRDILRIDNEIYCEIIDKIFKKNISTFSREEQKKARHYLLKNGNLMYLYRLIFNGREIGVLRSIDGKEIDFKSDQEKIKEWMIAFKKRIMSYGVLHYDDAYFLANLYLSRNNRIKSILQKRFQYVFVDEMQDMNSIQSNLLERIFFDDGNSKSIFQRVGDKNQAIYSNIETEGLWVDRNTVLHLKGSHRLTQPVAQLVSCFAIERDVDYQITGLRSGGIKPHLIVYKDCSSVLGKYSELLHVFIQNNLIDGKNGIFKAVGWRKSSGEQNKLSIENYYPQFIKEHQYPKNDYDYIEDYLTYFDATDQTLRSSRKGIVNIILRVLREESIFDSQNRFFNDKSLIEYLRTFSPDFYEKLNHQLYCWSSAIRRSEISDTANEIKRFIPSLLNLFGKEILATREFIQRERGTEDTKEDSSSLNVFNIHGFDIEVATVHSVKGQTCTAILYLETFFQRDGKKSYESERLSEQLKFIPLGKKVGKRVKQSSKMIYVGFSRPTHLLCFAVQEQRFYEFLEHDLDLEKWIVVRI
jgi:DNA helicase-2/ATP-dependent DNA helicase PcrA